MRYRPGTDLISQAELRKGAEFMIGASSAVRLVRELYLHALERRLARGAVIEPGPLSFVQSVGVVLERKEVGRETQVAGTQPLGRSTSTRDRCSNAGRATRLCSTSRF